MYHKNASRYETKTPIKYLVIIYQENRPFDHLFGTYPCSAHFEYRCNTPTVNGFDPGLLYNNQNGINPFKLTDLNPIDPHHDMEHLQFSMNNGLMDRFVKANLDQPNAEAVMGYYDGDTVTALWNYAQNFALNDNFFSTVVGASTIGAINLVSGQTHGAIPEEIKVDDTVLVTQGTIVNDIDPTFDIYSKQPTTALTGLNIGNLLNNKYITWGWFQGGFADGTAVHVNRFGVPVVDYIPHHNPFQYYQSTSNPNHLPPSTTIGFPDQANHNYDLKDFWLALKRHQLPAVSFVRPSGYQDGHPGYSSVVDFQEFLVDLVNRLQRSDEWESMAIVVASDDSGGFYDHVMPPIINQSQSSADTYTNPGIAGTNPPLNGYQGRFGRGLRLPLLVISPYARKNYVDHTLTDQTSILRFIEDNWNVGKIGDASFDAYAGSIEAMFDFTHKRKKKLFLDPCTGSSS
jgi:phospholipase C